jgi:integrase
VAQDWSDVTVRKVASGYGRWLVWLDAQKLLRADQPPGARVDRERVRAYAEEGGRTCRPYTVSNHLQDLANALRVLAPQDDWRWLHKAAAAIARTSFCKDKRARLRTPGELIALGQRLMDQADAATSWSTLRRAVQFRDGLMIALLASRPIRMRNLASMQLGTHLVERDGAYWLLFQGHETKSGAPYEAVLPASLLSHLRQYLDVHRPRLVLGEKGQADPSLAAVWVSEVGTKLDQGVVGVRVRKHTKKAFGLSITPHLFRDAAATEIAINNPAYIDDARHLLGQASPKTTERYYNQAHSLMASRAYHRVLGCAVEHG